MSRRPLSRRPRWQRGLAVVLGAAVTMAAAVGPSHLAAAVGLHAAAPSAPQAPPFLPEPSFVRVQSPHILLQNLTVVRTNSPIPVVGGTSPANTTLLVASQINLDDLQIANTRNGVTLDLANPGTGTQSGQVGSAGGTFYLWGVLKSLDFCLSASNLLTLVQGYAGPLGGLLGTLQNLIAGLPSVGCPPIADLLPILQALSQAGVPLPSSISANNLDIDVYALDIYPGPSGVAVGLPHGQLRVHE
jgi:hypothetical protein